MSWPLDQTRRASMPGCRSSTSCGPRRVKDLGILSMDGVSDWRRRQGCIPHATVQRCIVHPVRNSIRHPTGQWSAFTKQLKLIYGHLTSSRGPSGIREVQDRLAGLSSTSGAGKQFLTSSSSTLWQCAQDHTRLMPLESVNSSFRKVTKKGAFPNEDVQKSSRFYLRIQELYKKWKGRHVATGRWSGTSCSWTTGCLSLCSSIDVAY